MWGSNLLYFLFYIFTDKNECLPIVGLSGDIMVEGVNFPDYKTIYNVCTLCFVNLYTVIMILVLGNFTVALLTANLLDFKHNKEREFME